MTHDAADTAFALSSAQQEIWFDLQLHPTREIYVLQGGLEIEGPIEPQTMQRALRRTVQEFEAFRLTFETRDGMPVQRVRDSLSFDIPVIDRSGEADPVGACLDWMKAARTVPFADLSGPLFSFAILSAGPRHWYVCMTFSHLVMDGWSSGPFIQRLAEIYRAEAEGEALPLRVRSYIDFVRDERDYLASDRYRMDSAFWAGQLRDWPLPVFDRVAAPETHDPDNRRHGIGLPRSSFEALSGLAVRCEASVHDLLLLALGLLLQTTAGRPEVVLGVTSHNRTKRAFRETPGMFTSVLPSRVRLDTGMTVRDALTEIRRRQRGHIKHQRFPLRDMARILGGQGESAPALYDVSLSYEPFTVPAWIGGHRCRLHVLTSAFNRQALHVALREYNEIDDPLVHLDYDAKLVEPAEIARIGARFVHLLGQLAAGGDKPLADLELISPDERAELGRFSVGESRTDLAWRPFLALFGEQVRRQPHRTAVSCGIESLSYGALDAETSRLARVLTARGVGPGDIVGVHLGRSVRLPLCFLAILKARAAYMPLDTSYPAARLRSQCEQARPQALIVDAAAPPAALAGLAGCVIDLDADAAAIADEDPAAFELPSEADGLAYVIFTSGSTGAPLGVLVGHAGLSNLALAQSAAFGVDAESRVLQFAPFGFDASISEFVMALATGATLDLGPGPERPLGPDLCAYIAQAGITHLTISPSLLRVLPAGAIPEGLTLIVAGEHCPPALAAACGAGTVFNAYGPTEATVCTTLYRFDPATPRFPIGRPMANVRVYLLDEALRPVPVGVVGTLYVGGLGLAWGYLGRPDVTAARFRPDPFAAAPGARMYDTGDLARWLPDGNIEFCGRRDDQVKVRGHRIALAEVEAALAADPAVRAAVVRPEPREDGSTALAAWLVARDGMAELAERRIAEWRSLYDALFDPDSPAAAGAGEGGGWQSSYTGAPIPADEMAAWLDEAVRDITAAEPRRILEIGCGAGQLAVRLAPDCAVYVGTDLSAAVLRHAKAALHGRPGAEAVTLLNRTADDFSGFADASFDAVVLNSVVQYFPNEAYLRQVIDGALRVTRPGGTVYVGDVRCLNLAEAFHLSVEAVKAPPGTTARALQSAAAERGRLEDELLIDPAWFRALAERHPAVSGVRIRLATGRVNNELSKFRYRAFLQVADAAGSRIAVQPAADAVTWLDRTSGPVSLEMIEAQLAAGSGSALGVRSVPNARLGEERALLAWLTAAPDETIDAWRMRQPGAAAAEGLDPADLDALARRYGRQLAVSHARDGDPTRMDVVFHAPGRSPAHGAPEDGPGLSVAAGSRPLTNAPLSRTVYRAVVPDLHRRLARTLPAHMLPTAYAVLESLPVTVNGKLDHAALPEPWPVGLITAAETDPAGPFREEETDDPLAALLARLWTEVLNIPGIGLHDSFQDVGGDSIHCIQFVSRAREQGIALTVRQVFECQTVARLVAAIRDDPAATPVLEDRDDGPVPLAPVQHWFFDTVQTDRHHFNQYVLTPLPPGTDPDLLRRAFALVQAAHDSLRLRFARNGPGWRQTVAETDAAVPFDLVDLTGLPFDHQIDAVLADAAGRQAGLDLGDGPIWRAIFYRTSAGAPDWLLWTVHHLGVDGVSWRILLEDMDRLYTQLAERGQAEPPARTTPYAAWCRRLQSYAHTPEAAEALVWWADGVAEPAPERRAHGTAFAARRQGNARRIEAGLDPETSDRLTQAVGGRLLEAFLAALCRAWQREHGVGSLTLLLERHGREALFDDVDLSRTTGWFTSLFPVRLAADPRLGLADALAEIAAHLARVPHRGVDFGVVRYLGPAACRERLAALGVPPVSLNYLGHFDPPRAGSLWAHLDASGIGLSQAPGGPRYCPLDIQILRMGEGFHIAWTYDPADHDESAVARMSETFVGILRDLASLGDGPVPALSDGFPLSPTQEGVLFHAQLDRSGELYFEQLVFDIEGRLDVRRFHRAWQAVLARHDMLRTRFVRTEAGRLLQEVVPSADLGWLALDWTGRDAETQARDLAAFLTEDRTQRFVLDRAPLFRLAVIRLAEDRAHLVWSHHHAVLDGWSVPLVLKDVLAVYGAADGTPPRPRPAAGFRDYIDWLETQRTRPETARYWRQALAGFRSPTSLPGDMAAGTELAQGPVAEDVTRTIDPALADRLRQLARESRVTVGTMVQGLWALLLARAIGAGDVVFGTTGSGRSAPLRGIESLVGVFIQTLPVRVRIPETQTLIAFLRGLQAAHVEREAHGHCGLVAIQGWSEIAHGEPLFDSLVVVENYPVDSALSRETGGIRLGIRQARVRTNYPLTLSVVPGEGLGLTLSYDPARYSAAFCTRVLEWLDRLVRRLAAEPDQPLHGIDLLDGEERRRILALFDRRDTARPSADTLVDLVERQAARTPDATALVHCGRSTTYAAMEAAANRLARHLAGRGIGPEARVGLCLGRSDRTVIAMLAIMKAGAAYVPLDPKYPPPRLALIAECAALTAIVTEAGCRTAVDGLHPVLVDLDAAGPALGAESDAPLPRTLGADDLAYVLFTSGSTGRPKGVAIPHRGGVTLMAWAARTYAAGELRRTLFSTSVNFDLSVFEIFAPLSTGGAVVVAETVLELPGLSGVTLVNTVPSAMAELLRTDGLNDSVRTVNLAGEALPRSLVDALYRCPSVKRVFNLYGPSETTTYSTGALLPRDSATPPPIGVPLDGEAAYVLDANFNLMPFGLAGELHLAGEGVAQGYLFDPRRTAEAFLPNPFARTPGERLYRTGDQARYRPDGEIDFLGRKDHQIKIRGFRLELGEIETALLAHDGVQEAAVTFHENPATGAFLAAHVVPADAAAPPEPADVRAHLRGRLPDHAVPRLVQLLPGLPMTPNGKKDRVRLAAMLGEEAVATGSRVPAATATEAAVANIFARILQLEAVGRSESFFDLGGHSLLVPRLAFALRKTFGVELSLADVYARPTVADLAEAVEAGRRLPVAAGPAGGGRAIRLNETEAGQPLYLVCPASGSPMCYRELAEELAGVRPVWGFEAPGLQPGEQPCRTVGALADHLLPELLVRHRDGTLLLGGWSFGGWVAFELARRLRRHGRDAVVLLIDPELFGRPTEDQPAPRFRDWWRRLRRELAGMRFDERFSYAALRRFAGWLGISLPASLRAVHARPLRDQVRFAGATGASLLRSIRVFWTHYRANRRFRLSYLHADVHLFRTRTRSAEELDADPVYQGLKRTVSGHVGILPVPGTHLTLFESRNRVELARLIERQLASYGPASAPQFAIRDNAPAPGGSAWPLPPESQPVHQALFSSVDTRHEERKR